MAMEMEMLAFVTEQPLESITPLKETVFSRMSPVVAGAAAVINTDQELLDALDNRTRVLFHKPASEVIDFFLEIQDSVRTDNKEKLASLIRYPITIYRFDGDPDKEIPNAAEFVVNYEKIVTPEWKDIILAQAPAGLRANWQGLRVSRGELWFATFCLDKSCQNIEFYITTINHTDW